MRELLLILAVGLLACGKPIVHRDTTLPDPVVIHNSAAASDSVDRHDSVITVIEYRHDTTNDCDSVFTTTAKVQKIVTVTRQRDTLRVPVPEPYVVRDTIYQPRDVSTPYSTWKILGWLFLGLTVGTVVGFVIAAIMTVGKK